MHLFLREQLTGAIFKKSVLRNFSKGVRKRSILFNHRNYWQLLITVISFIIGCLLVVIVLIYLQYFQPFLI